jgi:hypothetical protein
LVYVMAIWYFLLPFFWFGVVGFVGRSGWLWEEVQKWNTFQQKESIVTTFHKKYPQWIYVHTYIRYVAFCPQFQSTNILKNLKRNYFKFLKQFSYICM